MNPIVVRLVLAAILNTYYNGKEAVLAKLEHLEETKALYNRTCNKVKKKLVVFSGRHASLAIRCCTIQTQSVLAIRAIISALHPVTA